MIRVTFHFPNEQGNPTTEEYVHRCFSEEEEEEEEGYHQYTTISLAEFEGIKKCDPYYLLGIYYYKKMKKSFDKLCNHLTETQHRNPEICRRMMFAAVVFKDVETARKFIDFTPVHFLNEPMDMLCNHGCVVTGSEGKIYQKKISSQEDDEVLQLVRMCLQKGFKPKKGHYDLAEERKNFKIIDIFREYESEDVPLHECCYVCATKPGLLITDICACKALIHPRCAQELIMKVGYTCRTCHQLFRVNVTRYKGEYLSNDIYFPSIGFYPVPLFSNSYTKVETLESRLHYAVVFLQLDEVQKCLNEYPSWEKVVENHAETFKYIGFQIQDEVKVNHTFPSNYTLNDNKTAYEALEIIFNHKKGVCLIKQIK